MRFLGVWLFLCARPQLAAAQAPRRACPPVIDVHVHSGAEDNPQSPEYAAAIREHLTAFDSLNIRHAVVGGLPEDLAVLSAAEPKRFIPGLLFPCEAVPGNRTE